MLGTINHMITCNCSEMAKNLEDMHKVGKIIYNMMNTKPSPIKDIGDLVNLDEFDLDLELFNDLQ